MKSAGIAAHARGILFGIAASLALASTAQAASQIDNAALSNDADGSNWAANGRTFDEQHFSPLTQINTQNIGKLGLAWSLDFDDVWNMATMPVEVDGVVYVAAGYSVIHAVDVRTGKLLWKYDPHVGVRKMRMAWGIRGLTYWNGKIYAGVQDGRLFALDAHTGELVWETQTTEPDDNRYITGAPRVWQGTDGRARVIIGQGGADFGHVRGYVTTYDAETGQQIWRWWIVPGNPADGFENKAMEMAAKTWHGKWWENGGGGTAWNAMTYDPKYNRVYIGTGNGGPWNAKLRSPGGGDNLFLCSVVALDADTGEYVWHYQTTPDESWDFTSTMDIELATIEIDGKPRDVILHAPKNGFFYVIDRATGKLISAEKLGKVTWAKYVDMKTGRPVENKGARYEDGEAMIWPGSAGLHNWPPMSYSPDTGLVYIPAHEMAGYYNDAGRDPSTWKMSKGDVMGLDGFFDDVPKNAGSSSMLAWNPVTQKKAWEEPTPGANNGGVMATAGGLVFQGQADGKFVAHDAKTGKVVWSFDMGVGSMGSPISYEVDGKQYISIPAGWAGGQMLLGSLSAQHGWVGRDHPRRLLTFVLDGDARLPPTPPPAQVAPLAAPEFKIDPALAEKGKYVYQQCVICHGVAAVAGGYAPDLRASQIPLSTAAFTAVVRDGGLLARGMPQFSELSDEDILALQNYIRDRARYKPSAWDQIRTGWHFLMLMLKMKLKALFG
ncbi:PQQ-dependent dehydrogenase, methanol/ethanol family [Solimonas terrae]|uniref:PQQ-dependent dehydrogenase, methanol/ethanol family n=1 Tax=Solimonas terrae TaxID=1396819 RepID=A0A6M2BPN7_9GAMM|nr:PQQ-dependent dehydrogenase, methanol/ethanol family [Solimonas terrae]NGY04191.1 PQQ-dependent dehydrogenase, methanol/ethanol family [Solimonas terrae]